MKMCRRQFGIFIICLVNSVLACTYPMQAQSPEEPEPLTSGGFVQQLRALPAQSVEQYQFSDSDNHEGSTKRYASVAQAQAQARANAYQSNSGYPLPAQPTGRSTLQRTHESPWLERLNQGNQRRGAESNRMSDDVAAPIYRSVQGRTSNTISPRDVSQQDASQQERYQQEASRSIPMSVANTPPKTRQGFSLGSQPSLNLSDMPESLSQTTLELSPTNTGEVHVETKLPNDLMLSQPLEVDSQRGDDRRAIENSPMNEHPSSALTADSLQQAPRVSRVPLPRPAAKKSSVKSSVSSVDNAVDNAQAPVLPDPMDSSSQVKDKSANEANRSTPRRIPAIPTSVAPLLGTNRISNATIKSTLAPSGGESVRIPAQLSDATRAEQHSIGEQERPTQNIAEPTEKETDVANTTPTTSRSLADDPTALELELPNLPLPSTSSTGGEQRGELPPLPSLTELPSRSAPAAPTIVRNGQPVDAITTTPTVEKQVPVDVPPTAESEPVSVPATPTANSERSAASSLGLPKLMTGSQRLRAEGENVASPDERLRMEAPRVQVLLNGPADLPIGIPAQYDIVVRNDDRIDLNGLILRLDVPAGIQVQPLRPSHGQFEVEQSPDGLTMLTWGFEHLAAGKTATAPMRLVASTAKNFAVAMEWTLVPVAGASNVAVSAPRLELALEGPAEVLFTQPNVYRLHLRNPGNAAAKNVAVRLNAEPHGSSTTEVAHIAPGEEEVIEVELTFNKRGNIQIAAQAREQSGLSSETAINVMVRQPIIQSQMIATESIYYGSPAECRVTLSNSGDADATNLQARMQLPAGANLISAPSGAMLKGSELTWPVGTLVAGCSEEFLVHLGLAKEGANLHQFKCSNSAGLETTAKATTHVEAISDLKLFVNDPLAPAPVGSEVVYELTLANRGSKAATNVKVIAQFSDGIEPIRGEGQTARVVPGQALFDPIARISAGESKTLKVIAQASAGGIHRFRAEVRSDDEEVRLVQEESTQYLEGASRIASPPVKSSLR